MKTRQIEFKIAAAEKLDSDKIEAYRKVLVSPSVNTPEPFQGFGGMCGWPKVCRLQNGDLYVTHSASYWHTGWRTPIAESQGTEYAGELAAKRTIPWILDWDAPEGVKCMWIRSSDNGRTWTKPKAFPQIPNVYYIGDVVQMTDGTMFSGAVVQIAYGMHDKMPSTPLEYAKACVQFNLPRRLVVFRSDDIGESWYEVSRPLGPFLFPNHPQTFMEGKDGSLIMFVDGIPYPAGEGWPTRKEHWLMAMMRSIDQGETWETVSVFGNNSFLTDEPSAEYLPDGSIGTPSRPTSHWWQSWDEGKTWVDRGRLFPIESDETQPIYKKGDLLVTGEGVTVLVYCTPVNGYGQVIYSRDNGDTWVKTGIDSGFQFDPLSYYPDACLLEDDTIFVVGDHQGFKCEYGPYGAESIAMRFRIKKPEEGEGIELLPIG